MFFIGKAGEKLRCDDAVYLDEKTNLLMKITPEIMNNCDEFANVKAQISKILKENKECTKPTQQH